MRLYACYTPSHNPLLEQHFLPSIPCEFTPLNTGLVLRELPQRSSDGAFASEGFQATCLDKVDFILKAIRTETKPFLFSDVDVRFYGPVVDDLTKLLGDADMAFQWDGPRGRECTGFMVLRPSGKLHRFWENVRDRMAERDLMDQDALHAELEVSRQNVTSNISTLILPDRYWTFGRDDKHWSPGMSVNPPADLRMHHANWTVGIENKLALLEAVKARFDGYPKLSPSDGPRPRVTVASVLDDLAPVGRALSISADVAGDAKANAQKPTMLYVDSGDVKLGERMLSYSEVTRMLEDQRRRLSGPRHHPLPLALVLQFWKGDKRRALDLARLLADIEPARRSDVCFVFARQDNCPMDEEIAAAQLYVGRKFPVMDLVAKVDESKKYPGVCFDAWASACSQLAEAYYDGRLPYPNAFFFEADGCPIGSDWIDRIKGAHTETLMAGKRVTGPIMRFGGIDRQHQVGGHVNGTLVMHLSMWFDRPSIHRCPPDAAWDVFLGNVFVAEAGTSQIIRNEHGARGLSESLYWVLGKECCWISSLKDGSAHHWAREMLAQERARADGGRG